MKGEECGERCGQFNILSQDMLRGTEENYEKPHERKDSHLRNQDEDLSISAL
jgi:hypothetical protein